MLSLTSLPTPVRPREKILTDPFSVSLEELVAVLLGTGGENGVLGLAAKVSRAMVEGAGVGELQAIQGIGPAKAAQLLAALQLSGRLAMEQQCDLISPQAVAQAMEDLVSEPQEHLAVFFLSSRATRLRRQVISIGTASASLVHPREVFRPAIAASAVHIVVAHTHPSGDASPSAADLTVTRSLVQAGRIIGIDVIDHVVCAKTSFSSLREQHPALFSESNFIGNERAF